MVFLLFWLGLLMLVYDYCLLRMVGFVLGCWFVVVWGLVVGCLVMGLSCVVRLCFLGLVVCFGVMG